MIIDGLKSSIFGIGTYLAFEDLVRCFNLRNCVGMSHLYATICSKQKVENEATYNTQV